MAQRIIPGEPFDDVTESPVCREDEVTTELPPALRPTLKLTLKVDKWVTAVCLLNGQLYLIRYGNKEINVYDATKLTLQRNIEMSVPNGWPCICGLAACSTNDCLYAADCLSSTVYRMNLTATDSKSATKWSVARNPYGLSVNSIRNLLVAFWDARKIQEYNTNGSLVREISESNCTVHALELNKGTIVVSQTGPVHGVTLKLIDGRDIKTYGSTTAGSGPGQMNYPRYLAVDSEGFIIVADCHNNRILVLNPELTEARPLPLSSDVELETPVALCYEESLGNLYVSQNSEPYGLLMFSNVINLSTLFAL